MNKQVLTLSDIQGFPGEKEANCSCVNVFTPDPESIMCICGEREKHIYNQGLRDCGLLPLPLLTELDTWEILAVVYGCKREKEDCSFKRCSHWVKCELLVKAIHLDQLKKVKE